MARKPSVEVYASRELIGQVEAWRDEQGISNTSKAWRELARRGLQREDIER